ncbi:uncharacterized protein LOC127733257 [Mytilus californianus]|uniref:uncharacterized protein LOC127733257 n=1 Tax=Mytilus californianus TaxID=6549 RepID=UPI00224546E3|nr:uncharacterized protein LOC127733257 [Mytilus californianus]
MPSIKEETKFNRVYCIRKSLIDRGFSESSADVIIASWRPSTIKQYQYSWRKFVIWCVQRKTNSFRPSEKDVIDYLNFLKDSNFSYSVLNTTRSMLTQTLSFFGVDVTKFVFVDRMLKGCFNLNPPRARYSFTWDVNLVLTFLSSLYPLEDLTLKTLTFKLVSLVALTTAARAQSISALDLHFMSFSQRQGTIVFHIQELLKTTRPGFSLPNVVFKRFDKPELCVVKTMINYVLRTKDVRKTSSLFISYATFRKVSTSTLSRWLKTVLLLAGIDINIFKAHSFRCASTSAALASGCSIKDIMVTANWTCAKTFYKFYYRELNNTGTKDFSSAVITG